MKLLHTTLLLASLCMSCNAGEIFVSKKYGFFARFPANPVAANLKSAMGDNLVVSAGIVEEEPPKILFYQIIVSQVAGMKAMPEFSPEQNLKLTKKNLEVFLTEGICTNINMLESKNSSWPAVEFSCKQKGFVKDGIVSHKRGYAFLIKDTYYKVIVHSLEDNKELKDEAFKFFAGFSFAATQTIEQMEATTKSAK